MIIFCNNVFKYCWVGVIVLFRTFTTLFFWGKLASACFIYDEKNFLLQHILSLASDDHFSWSPREENVKSPPPSTFSTVNYTYL